MFNSIKELFSSRKEKISDILSDQELKELSREWLSINRWSVFIFLVLSSIAMIIYVQNVYKSIKLSDQILQLEKTERRLDNQIRKLESQIIQLQSADRITKIAEENLGMIKSEKKPITLKVEDE